MGVECLCDDEGGNYGTEVVLRSALARVSACVYRA